MNTVSKTKTLREGQDALAYGQTIDEVHQLLLDEYIPVMDFKIDDNTYFVDEFRVYFSQVGTQDFLALYKNKILVAIAPYRAINMHPNFHSFYCSQTIYLNTRGQSCDLYSSDEFFRKLIMEFNNKKVPLGKNTLNLSEEEIIALINEKSDEQESYLNENNLHFLLSAPMLAVALPIGVASAPVTGPIAVAYQVDSRKKAKATPARLTEIRNIPLGISPDETETSPENVKLAKARKNSKSTCQAQFHYIKNPKMQYNVWILSDEHGTFKRFYFPT